MPVSSRLRRRPFLVGAGTPFVAVIDGTRGTKESPEFRIVYKRAGFEGTKKLRQVIDAVKPAHPAEKTSARQAGDPEHARRDITRPADANC